MKPAVFWDRDGVINVSPGAGYVLSWEEFHLSPGIAEALKVCQELSYALVVVTSQQGVGKGLMSMATLDEIHERMQDALGLRFDAILHCTHLSGTCSCRKPSPEMIHRAAEMLDLDLSQSWMIGDHDRDIEMGLRAGITQNIRVISHHQPGVQALHTVLTTSDLAELLSRVLRRPGDR
jgi:D-glycero-D-manno-heptose 1,7-bisphosphate phosphatase